MAESQARKEQRLAVRDARREAQREAALQPVTVNPEPKNWISVAIGAGGTAVYLTLGAWSYSAAAADDMIGAGILLVLAFFVAVGALMASEKYGGLANRRRLVLNLIFAAAMAAISGLLFWWEYSHRPVPTDTADEISKRVLEGIRPSGSNGGAISNASAPTPQATTGPKRAHAFIHIAPGASIRGATIKNNRFGPVDNFLDNEGNIENSEISGNKPIENHPASLPPAQSPPNKQEKK